MPTIDDILRDFSSDRKELITILHQVQEEFGYLPQEAIRRVARFLKISESEIFGVLTFYTAFSLTPKGRHVVKVCLGTACYVRGGAQISTELGRELCLSPGETSPNGDFTLETVNCLGCCAIGPVIVVGKDYYGHTTVRKVGGILKKYQEPEES